MAKDKTLQGTLNTPSLNMPDFQNDHAVAFGAALRQISRDAYAKQAKSDSKVAEKIMGKSSDVSGSVFSSVMSNLESMRGGDISKEYTATMGDYEKTVALKQQQVNDTYDNNYKKLQTAKIVSDLGGYSVYIPSGTLADRNNNPGNLRFVGQAGATMGANGFAAFASPEAGYEALKSQVQLDQSRGETVAQFIAKYAPPGENDTALYIAQFDDALGVSGDTKLSDLDTEQIAQFMCKKESGTQILGSSTSSGGQAVGTTGSATVDTTKPG